MKLFVPIKGESIRVPRKNFRDFLGKPLYIHTLSKFNDFDIFVDTDSGEIEEGLKDFKNITIIRRKPELIGNDISVNLLIENCVNNYCNESDIICQIHVTSPFLNPETLIKAHNKLMKEGLDSICSCNELQTRLWRKEDYGFVPINHNPMKLEKTQDLPIYYEENSAFYMFTVKAFKELNNRISANHSFQTIEYPETLDIDTEEDFKIALNTKFNEDYEV
jgi:CMP-N-acetylneuraminic acid synthetase